MMWFEEHDNNKRWLSAEISPKNGKYLVVSVEMLMITQASWPTLRIAYIVFCVNVLYKLFCGITFAEDLAYACDYIFMHLYVSLRLHL